MRRNLLLLAQTLARISPQKLISLSVFEEFSLDWCIRNIMMNNLNSTSKALCLDQYKYVNKSPRRCLACIYMYNNTSHTWQCLFSAQDACCFSHSSRTLHSGTDGKRTRSTEENPREVLHAALVAESEITHPEFFLIRQRYVSLAREMSNPTELSFEDLLYVSRCLELAQRKVYHKTSKEDLSSCLRSHIHEFCSCPELIPGPENADKPELSKKKTEGISASY